MVSSFNRRTFLIGAAATVGAVACDAGKKSAAPTATTTPVITVPKPGSTTNQLNLLVTSGQFLAGVDQRVGLVMKGQEDFVHPDSPVSLAFGRGQDPNLIQFGAAVTATAHTDSDPAPPYVTATYRFPTADTYWVRASYKGQTADAPLMITDPTQSDIPIPGKPMISTPTPTFDNHRGVEPICTRSPVCPWHDVSLDAALAQHRPAVVLFATPALCQTATCGPVLDQLLKIKTQFDGKVRFLHSEIYTDNTAKINTPAVLAYHLNSEPILFLAGPDGVVKNRIDGLYGRGEIEAAVAKLVSG